MKFKKDDRVRVKSNSRFEGGRYADKPGIVISVTRPDSYPYNIKFDDEAYPINFSGNELEKEE